jgi:hypothetical protein
MRGLGKEAVTEQGQKVLMVIGEVADEFVCKIVKMGEVELKGMQNEFIRSDIKNWRGSEELEECT